MGIPLADETTQIEIDSSAQFYIWVRTRNWVPGTWESPGRFQIYISGKQMPNTLGNHPE